MKGKTLRSGERKIIFNVFNYFKTENPSLKRNALVEMTVKATGASAISVKELSVKKMGPSHLVKVNPKERKHSIGWTSLILV